MTRVFGFVAGSAAVSSVAAFAGAIWTSGDLSTRLGGTGGLLAVVALIAGCVSGITSDSL